MNGRESNQSYRPSFRWPQSGNIFTTRSDSCSTADHLKEFDNARHSLYIHQYMDNNDNCKSETTSLDLSSATGRYFNDTAIRDHALECSKRLKGGKFSRVGQDFIDEVHADIECFVRAIRKQWPCFVHEQIQTEVTFTTGALLDRIQPVLNEAIARLIQNKVQKQPSCGKTLSRTR